MESSCIGHPQGAAARFIRGSLTGPRNFSFKPGARAWGNCASGRKLHCGWKESGRSDWIKGNGVAPHGEMLMTSWSRKEGKNCGSVSLSLTPSRDPAKSSQHLERQKGQKQEPAGKVPQFAYQTRAKSLPWIAQRKRKKKKFLRIKFSFPVKQ